MREQKTEEKGGESELNYIYNIADTGVFLAKRNKQMTKEMEAIGDEAKVSRTSANAELPNVERYEYGNAAAYVHTFASMGKSSTLH